MEAEELAKRIVSNPDTAIDTLAREELGLDPSSLGSPWTAAASSFFAFACGAAMFGKPRKFRRVLRQAGVDPARAIAIGDEVRDIEAARAAGIACAAVTWGYAAPETLHALGPDLVFERMEDIARGLAPG